MFVAALLFPVGVAYANTLTVTTTADSVPGSLRATIAAANAGDTVAVPAGDYQVTAGEIPITQPITVLGAGASSSMIDAGGNSRVFHVVSGAGSSGGGVTFNGVEITGGNTSSQPGGGGILVDAGGGDLTLIGTVVSGNTVNVSMGTAPAGGGGGVYNAGGNTTVTGSSISGNTATVTDSGSCCQGGGGLFGDAGAVTITGSHLDNNQLTVNGPAADDTTSNTHVAWCCDGGGALRQLGNAPTSISGSTLNGNSATINSGDCCHGGGAIAVGTARTPNDSLTIDSSTLSGNDLSVSSSSTFNGGGAIEYDPDTDATPAPVMKVTNSLISGNSAALTGSPTQSGGGGVYDNNGGDSFVNSTIAGNTTNAPATAGSGGGGLYLLGLFTSYVDTLANVTISGNSAPASSGGGLYASPSATVRVKNSIVALNSAGSASNCSGTVSSRGYNLEDSPGSCGFTATGDQVVGAGSIGLDPLANNGGPTLTEALQAGSAAVDHGNPAGCTDQSGAPLTGDQRGFARPSGPRCDVGAFEFEEHTLTVTVHGSGTVTGPGISCPGTCSHLYPAGTVVSLNATPGTSSAPALWSGACSGGGSCALTMSADYSAAATFATAVVNKGGGQPGANTGGNPGANTPAGGTHPAPRCTLTVNGHKVLLTRRHTKKGSKKAPSKPIGVLKVSVTCTQDVAATLTGTLTEVLKAKKQHRTRTFSLSALHQNLSAGRTVTLSERLPQQALAGLAAGKHESVVFQLVATNGNGRTTLTSRTIRLVGVKNG